MTLSRALRSALYGVSGGMPRARLVKLMQADLPCGQEELEVLVGRTMYFQVGTSYLFLGLLST